MAKQTFTTGQVLTAAQMTSLQQTAMGGGSATAKTANYVLVAADAGTTVAMNAAGATTITVNTSLFAAGDTVTIQNLGAGTCTVTAGTATVGTASSLALAQNEGGQLYFVSASAAIFFKYDGAQVTGGMTLISTTTLTGASVDITSIPSTYKNLQVIVRNYKPATDATSLLMRFNGDSTANRHQTNEYSDTTFNGISFGNTSGVVIQSPDNTVATNLSVINIDDYTNTTTWKMAQVYSIGVNATTTTTYNMKRASIFYNQTGAISSLTFFPGSGNFTSGDILLYGVK